MGLKICAPSMPFPAEPSSKLSRVTGQEACFSSLISVMPYLANKPFSTAIIKGAESVRAMNPSLAVVTSGLSAVPATLAVGVGLVLAAGVGVELLLLVQP